MTGEDRIQQNKIKPEEKKTRGRQQKRTQLSTEYNKAKRNTANMFAQHNTTTHS